MEAAYAAASDRLKGALAALGRPVPERIPLRLRGEDGLLLSALARSAGEEGGALAEALAGTLVLEGSPFDRVTAREGLLLLAFSRDWLEQVLAFYATLPWPEEGPETGLCRQDRQAPAFLRAYTLRRCKALAQRQGAGEPVDLPKGLICLLAQAPRGREEEILRRYWQLPPPVRRCPQLAGAVGRRAGNETVSKPCFTKNSPKPSSVRYNKL